MLRGVRPDGPLRVLAVGGGCEAWAKSLAQDVATCGVTHTLVCVGQRCPADVGVSVESVPERRAISGSFDCIDLSGDLMDLTDAEAGPAAYVPHVNVDGLLICRVPGALGRLGVQDVIDMLSLLPAAARTAVNCDSLLRALPATHRLRRGSAMFADTDADLFLGPRAAGQTVGEIAAWARGQGLMLEALLPPSRYDPTALVDATALRELFAALSFIDRCAVAELLAGDMVEHHFVARSATPEPDVSETEPQPAPKVARVQSQYESFPYPPRDPADERRRLLIGTPSDLAEVNHYVFGGQRDFTRPFRALVAGGGTGDATIMLAQQLTNAGGPGEVVHLDLSAASIAVARERARVRALDNIRFVSGSLLDLERLGLGQFDYVDCCGVLHHLPDPLAGLSRLVNVLSPDGGLGLMLYGELGRTGVYHLQEILRQIAPADLGDEIRLARARLLLDALPESNWLRRNPSIRDYEISDAGRFDLLLHAIDRAYRVPVVYDLCASAGLRIVTFLEPVQYDPEALGAPPQMRRLWAELKVPSRAAFAELFTGRLRKHVFQAVQVDNTLSPPDPADTTMFPILRDMDPKTVASVPAGGHIRVRQADVTLSLPVPPLAKAILQRVDGQRRIAEIVADIRELRRELDEASVIRQFKTLYDTFNGINKMHLSARPLYPKSQT